MYKLLYPKAAKLMIFNNGGFFFAKFWKSVFYNFTLDRRAVIFKLPDYRGGPRILGSRRTKIMIFKNFVQNGVLYIFFSALIFKTAILC